MRLFTCRELTLWLDDAEVRRALHAAPVEVTGPFQVHTWFSRFDSNISGFLGFSPGLLALHVV